MKYIVLDENKTATHKFKNGEGTFEWKDAKDFDNVGVMIPNKVIVLDFDSQSDSDIMMKIIEGENIACKVMKTARGIHIWFRSDSPWKNFKGTRLASGIHADCRSYGKSGYVKIKDKGSLRKFTRKCKLSEMVKVPRWLYPVSSPADTFKFKNMESGQGRNQELFNYVIYLQSKEFTRDEIRECIRIINKYVFADPLPEYEIKTILRDESFKPEEEIKKDKKKSMGKFQHNLFADELINSYHVITVNGEIYIYKDGYYQRSNYMLEQKMIHEFPAITQKQRSEVLSYIKIKTNCESSDISVKPYFINLKNTRLDVRNNKELPYDPKTIEFQRIPIAYNQKAKCPELENLLKRVFVNDEDVIMLFEEMLGYCLIKTCRYRKGFMLYGSGNNGKSTVLNIIKHFLGSKNFVSIELDKLTDKFKLPELENKLANIGDDINDKSIKDSGTIKKLLTGNSILVERKGTRPFEMVSTAKHLFSCNVIPKSRDTSAGWYSRMVYIPLNAVFSPKDSEFDPNIEDKVLTDEAMSYLLNRALKGVQRLLKNGAFTEPSIVQNALKQVKQANSTILTWIDDEDITSDKLLEQPTTEIYTNFIKWCSESNYDKFDIPKRNGFYKEVIKFFGFANGRLQKTDGYRYFIK